MGIMMANQRLINKRHDPDFRTETAKMVVDGGRRTADVARDVGVTYQTVHSWVKAYRLRKTAEASPTYGAEMQLKAASEEIRKLKIQVDFLKKTMAYFVELPK